LHLGLPELLMGNQPDNRCLTFVQLQPNAGQELADFHYTNPQGGGIFGTPDSCHILDPPVIRFSYFYVRCTVDCVCLAAMVVTHIFTSARRASCSRLCCMYDVRVQGRD